MTRFGIWYGAHVSYAGRVDSCRLFSVQWLSTYAKQREKEKKEEVGDSPGRERVLA